MNIFVLYLSLVLYISDIAKANLSSTNNVTDKEISSIVNSHRELTNADVLRRRIKERKWEEEELPCINTILDALNESKNFTLWAVWELDSMQLPVGQLYGSNYHIGNYDECMEPPWSKTHPQFKTQYCVAELHLTGSSKNKDMNIFDPEGSAEVYIKTRTKHDRDLARMTWGTCLPKTCESAAIIKIYRTLLKISHLGHFSEEANITVTSCEVAGESNELHSEISLFINASVIIFVIGCLSTYYTTLYYNPDMKSYFQEVIRSFCFRRNINSLKNVKDDEIYIINLMRVGTSLINVSSHLFFLYYGAMIINGLRIEQDIDMGIGYFNQADVNVDTFLTISGLLLVRGYFNGNWKNPFKFLTKRYLKIVSGLAVIIYIKTRLFYYMGNGPFWPKMAGPERDFCAKNWWHNLAMTSNYFPGSEVCYVISWSLPIDFHMSVIAVILCSLHRKSKRLAISIFWIVFTIAVVTAGWICYVRDLPPMSFHGIESLVNYRTNVILESTFVTTHTRAGTFMVGMAMGYIFAHYKPSSYRNVISKKWSYFLLIVSLLVMGSIFVVSYKLYLEPNRLATAVFTGLNRNLWSTMVVVIIAVCEYGDLGDLKAVINWHPLASLSRLTLGVFLIHMVIIERNVMSARALYRWDQLSMVEVSFGITLLSFICSFFLWLLVQAPTSNLVNLLLDGIDTKKCKKEITTDTSEEKLKTN